MSKYGNNLSMSRLGCFLCRSLVNFKNLMTDFLEQMYCLRFVKLRKCCFLFRTCKKRFLIHDPELLNSIPVPMNCFFSRRIGVTNDELPATLTRILVTLSCIK